MPVYMSSLERLRDEHVIDVMKMGLRPKRHNFSLGIKGTSNEAQEVREALAEDPYNLHLILELSYRYSTQGHIERCGNVMIRGWKRAGEIEDLHTRFCFLMKLCEVSYFLGRFKQAAAVLQDIVEPEDPAARKSYLLLSCHVYSANKEVQKTLKAFQRAIEGEDYHMAVRIYALTLADLKEVGMYSVAKSAVERLAPDAEKDSMLSMLDGFATREPDNSLSPDDVQRYFVIAVAVAGASILIYLLYLAEQWSLGKSK